MIDDVRESVLRLEAMAAVSPALAPVVKIAIEVCRTASAEAEAAEKRAELAVEAVEAIEPRLADISKRAEVAESRLAVRDEVDAAEDARVRHEKRAVIEKAVVQSEGQKFVAAFAPIAKQIAEQTAKTAELVEKLACVHKYTRDANGKSAIQNMSSTFGEWRVVDGDGNTLRVFERRSDAVKAVLAQIELERADPEHPDDELHSPVPWRRKKPVRVEHPPETNGVESVVSRRAKRAARIV